MDDFDFDDAIPREKVLFAFKGISLEGEFEGEPALLEIIFQDWGSPVPRATLRRYPDGIGSGGIMVEEIVGEFGQFDTVWTEKINSLLSKMDGEENGFTGETSLLNGPNQEPTKLDVVFSEQGIILQKTIQDETQAIAYIEIFGIYGEDNDKCFQNAKLVFGNDGVIQAIPVSTWAEAQEILAQNSIKVEFNSHTEPKHAGPQF